MVLIFIPSIFHSTFFLLSFSSDISLLALRINFRSFIVFICSKVFSRISANKQAYITNIYLQVHIQQKYNSISIDILILNV